MRPSTHTTLATAQVGFVHLDNTVQHWPICLSHGRTNAMAEIPRSLIANPDGTFHLVSREALAGFNQQNHSHKPSYQRQVGIVEHRARSYREMVLALGAVKLLFGSNPRDTFALAARTLDSVWPAQAREHFTALVVGVKESLNIKESHE
jgi:hypothetical protein